MSEFANIIDGSDLFSGLMDHLDPMTELKLKARLVRNFHDFPLAMPKAQAGRFSSKLYQGVTLPQSEYSIWSTMDGVIHHHTGWNESGGVTVMNDVVGGRRYPHDQEFTLPQGDGVYLLTCRKEAPNNGDPAHIVMNNWSGIVHGNYLQFTYACKPFPGSDGSSKSLEQNPRRVKLSFILQRSVDLSCLLKSVWDHEMKYEDDQPAPYRIDRMRLAFSRTWPELADFFEGPFVDRLEAAFKRHRASYTP